MRASLTNLWDQLRGSYWFVPSLMMLAAVVAALGAVRLDAARGARDAPELWWLYGGGPDGARAVLSTIAGSLMTMASLVFSITIVALTLASQQFGPRLLRGFLRDRVTQVALGTFTATFLYCLLVLRTIGGLEAARVPHVSVTFGVILSVVSVAMLIYFIHHVSISMQADTVIAAVRSELDASLGRLFPDEREEQAAGAADRPDFDRDGVPILSPATGYIQYIDTNRLLDIASRDDLVVRLDHRPGHFVVEDMPVGRVSPAGRADDDLLKQLGEQFIIGEQRTMLQDAEFGFDQLVEIGLRALSPGVNDPFTAMRCVDQISAALCRCAQATWPAPDVAGEDGRLRLVATRPETFASVVGTSFDQLRQVARTNAAVTIRLLEALAMVVQCARSDDHRDLLLRQAGMIRDGARESLPEHYDRQVVEERYREVVTAAGRAAGQEGP